MFRLGLGQVCIYIRSTIVYMYMIGYMTRYSI